MKLKKNVDDIIKLSGLSTSQITHTFSIFRSRILNKYVKQHVKNNININ